VVLILLLVAAQVLEPVDTSGDRDGDGVESGCTDPGPGPVSKLGAEEPQPDSGNEIRSAVTRARVARFAAEPVR